ncbi:FkbM family methyltransferase [Sulfitobacter donghicola DSW-25 = KCTC 12864 = JCM 14565]|uniref:FkbM family methyltransferase n=3 Tax=Sulfitobacter donghicola TaxID=421000 RepID=UPI000467F321|nr:FkbM family methyltransferase [Sulfitobacter donghicola]KIN70400.1 FkbM family methyltransferase [Sulfitobacter donghicola DSW-25 = KCTC 12864 = JCM 14565]
MNPKAVITYRGTKFQFIGNADEAVFKEISETGKFPEIDLLEELCLIPLRPGVIVDVGAEIGSSAVFLGRYCEREVIAFEASVEAGKYLLENIDLNGLGGEVTIRNGGLSDVPKWIDLQSAEGQPKREIFCRPLDSALPPGTAVSIIKIHPNTDEVEVLLGATTILTKHRPVVVVTIDDMDVLASVIRILTPNNYACLKNTGDNNTYIFVNRAYHASAFEMNYVLQIKDLRARLQEAGPDEAATLRENRFVLEVDRVKQINRTYNNLFYNAQKRIKELESASEDRVAMEQYFRDELQLAHGAYSDLFYNSVSEDSRRGITRPSQLRAGFENRLHHKKTELAKKKTTPPRIGAPPYLCEDVEIDKPVRIGIAAIPGRIKSLRATIESLLPQADEIYVSLNGFEEIPAYEFSGKVKLVLSENVGDLAKFGFLTDDFDGYYFTCDDDIIYPPYYVQSIVYYLQKYGGRIVAGWHGSEILTPFEDYYTASSRRVRTFGSYQATEHIMHVLGTGCIGFDTTYVRPEMSLFQTPNMADIYFALFGQHNQIPFLLVPHDRGEALNAAHMNDNDDSISGLSIKKSGAQLDVSALTNTLVGAHEWEKFVPVMPNAAGDVFSHETKPLRVLFLGRVTPEIWAKGGIFASCMLMIRQLEMMGCQVEAVELEGPSEDVVNSLTGTFDIGFVYGGDMISRDFFNVQKLIHDRTPRSFPLFFNLSYNLEESRTLEIVSLSEQLSPQDGLFVFTEAAKTELGGRTGRPVIVVPKTIREDVCNWHGGVPYEERSGIFCGDISKLSNPDLAPEAAAWIDAAAQAFGRENVTLVSQYKIDQVPEFLQGITIVPHQKDIHEVIGTHLLYAHFSPFCTFEMLPLEAAYAGTPVLYMDMPQSLNEYLGDSGICVHTPQDLIVSSRLLQTHEEMWTAYRERGQARGTHADWRSRAFDLRRAIDAHLAQQAV